MNETLVRIQILDHNGDSAFERKLEEAIQEVAKQKFAHSKWPYVGDGAGTDYFQFSATSMEDTAAFMEDCARLRRILEGATQPVVVLTADLVGGSR